MAWAIRVSCSLTSAIRPRRWALRDSSSALAPLPIASMVSAIMRSMASLVSTSRSSVSRRAPSSSSTRTVRPEHDAALSIRVRQA